MGVTGAGYVQSPLNADGALMTVTHVTDFLHNGSDWVFSLAFNPKNEDQLVSASRDCTMKVWSLTDGQCKQTLHGHGCAPPPLFSVVCSAVAGVTGTGYDQCPVNADRALTVDRYDVTEI